MQLAATIRRMPTDYVLEVVIDPADVDREEIVEGLVYLYGANGTISEPRENASVIRAFFEDEESRLTAAEQLQGAGFPGRIVDDERRDWLELYEQSLVPMEIGERFIVAPDARLISGSERIPLVVPQERAFGTGSHETTALCIEALEKMDLEGRRFVDIGTGSAILAMAAAKLGAAKVVAFDNDLEAYEAIRDNLVRNAIPGGQIAAFIGGTDALRGGAFDAATMNIIPEVIIPLLPDVRRALKPGATIVFSGILILVASDFTAAAGRQGFRKLHSYTRGEWWCGVFTTD